MRVMSPMAVKVLATLKWIMLVGYVILSPVGLPTIVYLWMRHSSISFFDQMANAFYGMDDFIGVSGKRFAMMCWYVLPTAVGSLAATTVFVLDRRTDMRVKIKTSAMKKSDPVDVPNSSSDSNCYREGQHESETSRNKLERLKNGTAAVCVRLWLVSLPLVTAAIIASRFYRRHAEFGNGDFWTVWASVSFSLGFAAIVSMMMAFLPLARSSVLLSSLGIDLMKAINYHKFIGNMAVLVAFLHGAGFIIKWLWQGNLFREILSCNPNHLCVLAGPLALICALFLWAFSRAFVRRRKFRLFYRAHMAFAIMFVIFVAAHYKSFFYFLVPGLLMLMIDVAYRTRTSLRRHALSIKASIVQGEGAHTFGDLQDSKLLKITIPKTELAMCFSVSPFGDDQPMQYIFLNIPLLSRIEWHPFSIIRNESTSDGIHHSIYMRVSDGGWTARLRSEIITKQFHDKSEIDKSSKVLSDIDKVDLDVLVQGPYASLLSGIDDYSFGNIIMVAGGTGIVPLLSLLLFQDSDKRHWVNRADDVSVVWCTRSCADLKIVMENWTKLCDNSGGRINISIYCTDDTQLESMKKVIKYGSSDDDSNIQQDAKFETTQTLRGKPMIEQMIYIIMGTLGSIIFMIMSERSFGYAEESASGSMYAFSVKWFQGVYLICTATLGMIVSLIIGIGICECLLYNKHPVKIARRCELGPATKCFGENKSQVSSPEEKESQTDTQSISSKIDLRRSDIESNLYPATCGVTVNFVNGRPNLLSILTDAAAASQKGRTLCLASGPSSLVDATRKASSSVRDGGMFGRLFSQKIVFHPVSFEL